MAAGVAVLHGGLFLMLSTSTDLPPVTSLPAIEVELFRPVVPPPPPPPPPPEPPAAVSGGGAPAAASRIHTPPKPRPVEPELPAPVVQAPKPALVVGVAPVATPTPGFGQGGQGTGSGTGSGDGDGPGSGSGCGFPRLLRGPNTGQIVSEAPPAARRARVSGLVNMRCELRTDTRLENCRVVNETPTGMGFGPAAVRVALARFRFAVPQRDGQPIARCTIPLGIQFNLGPRETDTSPAVG